MVSIYITRKTDGMIARLDVPELIEGWDAWQTIGKYFPASWYVMDITDLRGVNLDIFDRDVDAIFCPGEDSNLDNWLRTVYVTVRDSNGDSIKQLEGPAADRTHLIIEAIWWTIATIEDSGDTADVQVTITVGDEDLGIVVSCAVGEGETWLDALEYQYPETWKAIVNIRGMWSEHCELSDWLDLTIPVDCDVAEYVYTGRFGHE